MNLANAASLILLVCDCISFTPSTLIYVLIVVFTKVLQPLWFFNLLFLYFDYTRKLKHNVQSHIFNWILHFSKWFPTISVSPYAYDLVVFEDKGHICEVVAALLISTKAPLFPDTHHSWIWSWGLGSTMVKLRLTRMVTGSFLFTQGKKKTDNSEFWNIYLWGMLGMLLQIHKAKLLQLFYQQVMF